MMIDRRIVGIVLALVLSAASSLSACPFCTALGPTLSQRHEAAAVVAIGEMQAPAGDRSTFRLHRVLQGADRLAQRDQLTARVDAKLQTGTLAILLADAPPGANADAWQWSAVAVGEASLAYFGRAPSLRTPTDERLRYFAKFLEHPDSVIATDAYLEFGHAPLDAVAKVLDALAMDRVRRWLADDDVPQERKGLYGLVLGLAADPAERRANQALLRQIIDTPDDDFRAGFDGVLGGYLLLAGEDGLKLIEDRFLAGDRAAPGDVRHAQTALRFYYEYGRGIPAERIVAAMRRLIPRPAFAASAITDLARWQDWKSLDDVAAQYARTGDDDPVAQRAIVGYLLACPLPAAAQALERLRERDSAGVAAAEEVLRQLGGARQ